MRLKCKRLMWGSPALRDTIAKPLADRKAGHLDVCTLNKRGDIHTLTRTCTET